MPYAIADGYSQSIASKEAARRSENVLLAREMLSLGDKAYEQGDYEEAVKQYKQALSMVPKAGLAEEQYIVTAERYAQSSVEYAKQLARFGQYDEAKDLMETVLQKGVAPDHLGAKTMLAKLDDPIRYNPALTAEHSRDTEEVKKWLYKAEGYTNLGQFDEALLAYEEVLRIDRYNVAARRGMERVTQYVRNYQKSAYDQSRAELLSRVDGAWEMPVPRELNFVHESVLLNEKHDRIQQVRGAKLRQIMIPVVDFQNASIREVYDVIREWSREFDHQAMSAEQKGVNFVLNLGDQDSETYQQISNKLVTLNVRNVPLEKVLDYVSHATGTQWMMDDHAVIITPLGSADGEIRRRTFRVPPGFMRQASPSSTAQNDDPFADTPESNSVLSPRVSAQEFLSQLGVTFPDGASAKYIPGSGSLMVANTLSNLNMIEEYIHKFSRTESIQVVMKMTFMDVAMGDLEELGFDWLVGNTNDGDSGFGLGGGTTGSGRPIDSVGAVSSALSPVTSGNRSGEYMFNNSSAFGNGPLVSSGATDSQDSAPSALVLSTQDVQMIMRGLAQKKSIEMLDAPSVIARPGERATLFSGKEFIYPTEYEPPELPNTLSRNSSEGAYPVTPSHPTAFETRLVGLNMEVELAVHEDRNYVDVQMDVEKVDFDGFVNYGSPIQTSLSDPITGFPSTVTLSDNAILMPVFRKIYPGTAVTVQDGANVVIGSLQQSDIEDVEDKVPLLGDIPLVGRFFQSSGTRRVDRALLIFVNVEIQDPTGKPWRDR
ncbi:Amuc_1098 family type IV pilus outer membrane protein [Rubritalea spongiae]|uniref:Amuc_1098 family type IV pilus outer membrane protein n=1 Tax=Rubritalea spongiae TaxID=430797 RepID=A0ABW5DXF7_9BACT